MKTGASSARAHNGAKPRLTVQLVAQSVSTPRSGPARFQKTIKVLVVDDHPLVRRGLSSFLVRYKHLHIVGEAGDGWEALAKAKQLLPEVVLMDIDLPKLDGLTVTEVLHKENRNIKVILLSMHGTKQFGLRILQSGAHGFIPKTASAAEFAEAVQTVAAGGNCFGPDFAQTALEQVVGGSAEAHPLSQRQRQVLVGIAAGLRNKEIASRLNVDVRTVETHRESIRRKLNIETVAGLTKFALQQGLLWPEQGESGF